MILLNFLTSFSFYFFFCLVEAFVHPAVTQENGSQIEKPELNTMCCSTCKRPYEQSANEEQIAKRVKHDEVHSVCSIPTVSEDKFSYMGEVFDHYFNYFHLFILCDKQQV